MDVDALTAANRIEVFTAWAFTDRAKRCGLVPSMGSIGDCYDNAMIESGVFPVNESIKF